MADNTTPARDDVRRRGRCAASAALGRITPAPALFALLASLTLLTLLAPAARAEPPDRFHITAQERAACTSDAIRFCMHTYPDEDQLLACMKQNRDALTTTCRVAFDAGVKRRKL